MTWGNDGDMTERQNIVAQLATEFNRHGPGPLGHQWAETVKSQAAAPKEIMHENEPNEWNERNEWNGSAPHAWFYFTLMA